MEELILEEREFKEKIVDLVNNSSLPAFLIKSILKELLGQVELLEHEQYIQAKKNSKVNKKSGGTCYEKNT